MKELISYTEVTRDQIEHMLAEQANKPQIHWERRHGLEISVYYLRKLCEVSMSLTDGETYCEFIIPNDLVNDAIAHPRYYQVKAGLLKSRMEGWDGA